MRKLDFLNLANLANKLSAGQFESRTKPTPQNRMLKTKLAHQPQPANKLSRAKSAYQVLKKEMEKQKNLFVEVKFEQIPRIKNVDDNYAFDILLRIND
ncbi:hypothetical protein GCM10011514_41340 [Emticicia aquatilis]|uniref:Uncharacterized protein n=1 Tax=Emticicia aquatilis TaxID=1537369 RepID=A0A916Z2J2_9BACT|nr:hypothetical protein [Emticicia aquatilis]GGD73007.1 hypothetical protein GCM10011514_41340 [Emticicia aquatilis]